MGVTLLTNSSLEQESRLEVEGETGMGPQLRLGMGGELVRGSIAADVLQRAVPGGVLEEDIRYDSEVAFWQPALWGQLIWRPGRVTATAGLRAD